MHSIGATVILVTCSLCTVAYRMKIRTSQPQESVRIVYEAFCGSQGALKKKNKIRGSKSLKYFVFIHLDACCGSGM